MLDEIGFYNLNILHCKFPLPRSPRGRGELSSSYETSPPRAGRAHGARA